MQLVRSPGGGSETARPPSGGGLDAAARLAAAARAGTDVEGLGAARAALAALDSERLAEELADPADRLTFWINVYNGTVRARLLRDPGAYARRWRFFSTPAVTVAGRRLSPNAIEHGILRRSAVGLALGYLRNPVPSRFERLHRVERLDPRLHFALNCGARSCPPFAAWQPEGLETQLDLATRTYLHAETGVLADGEVRVPRLLLWYLGDFGGRAGIIRMLRHHGVIAPDATPQLRFGDYDWTLAVEAPPIGIASRRDQPA